MTLVGLIARLLACSVVYVAAARISAVMFPFTLAEGLGTEPTYSEQMVGFGAVVVIPAAMGYFLRRYVALLAVPLLELVISLGPDPPGLLDLPWAPSVVVGLMQRMGAMAIGVWLWQRRATRGPDEAGALGCAR